ncbi:MAG: hypothetical protein RR327_04290, partial [Clostridia bacterium]
VAPIVLIWTQYAENTVVSSKFKMTVTGLIMVAFIFMIFKKIWLNEKIKALSTKQVIMETQSLVVTDPKAIAKLKFSYIANGVISLGINLILPLCVFMLSILTCKALEMQVIKLYGVLCLCAVSYAFGYVCKLLEILTVTLPHEIKEVKK